MSRHVRFGMLLAAGLAIAAGPASAQQAGAVGTQDPAGGAGAPVSEAPAVPADTSPPPSDAVPADEGAKLTSVPGGRALGMSILGNQEAPTELVIVPWKTSELGGSLGVTPMLDDSRQPVDRDVFMRSLRYYEIRAGKTP